MKWLTRLLWGDERDHRLIRVEMPDKFPAYVSPRPCPTSFYSAYNDLLTRQMAAHRQSMMFGPQRSYSGLGMLGQLGSSLGASVGMANMMGRQRL